MGAMGVLPRNRPSLSLPGNHEPSIRRPRRVAPGHEHPLARQAPDQVKGEVLAFLKGVGAAPGQDYDVRHPERPFDGRVIGRADFLGKSQEFVGLDFGKLVHHDQSADVLEFRETFLKDDPFHELDGLVGEFHASIARIHHYHAGCECIGGASLELDFKPMPVSLAVLFCEFCETPKT